MATLSNIYVVISCCGHSYTTAETKETKKETVLFTSNKNLRAPSKIKSNLKTSNWTPKLQNNDEKSAQGDVMYMYCTRGANIVFSNLAPNIWVSLCAHS